MIEFQFEALKAMMLKLKKQKNGVEKLYFPLLGNKIYFSNFFRKNRRKFLLVNVKLQYVISRIPIVDKYPYYSIILIKRRGREREREFLEISIHLPHGDKRIKTRRSDKDERTGRACGIPLFLIRTRELQISFRHLSRVIERLSSFYPSVFIINFHSEPSP